MQKMLEKIPIAILGATGMVGQKFCELLAYHPWFKIVGVGASTRSSGKKYKDAVEWRMATPLDEEIGEMFVRPCTPSFPCKIVFSGLDAEVAGEIEEEFANAGFYVISNSRNHRMVPHVPLLIPEVNSPHLDLIKTQPYKGGVIVTNPNCSVIGITTALKPLMDGFGIEKVHVVTLQAVSGAGYPGISSVDIVDNVIPFIAGEEDKIEREPLKILGSLTSPYKMQISAHCNRVAVMDGHTACLSIQLKKKAKKEEIIEAWEGFSGEPQKLNLPFAPKKPLIYLSDCKHPQPKLHRNLENGMAIAIGGLRQCPLFDWKFTLLSHNTIRGAAGCAILNAELLVSRGFLK